MKPTKEQMKEFGKGCGLTFLRDKDGTLTWYDSEENFVDFGYPDIDLNNLFKYAVPKVDYARLDMIFPPYPKGLGDWSALYAWRATTKQGKNIADICDQDPTLALFWAIWSVIKNG